MRSSTTIRCLTTGRHASSLRLFVAAIVVLAAGVGSLDALAQTSVAETARLRPNPEWANVVTPMTGEDLRAIPPITGPSGRDLPPGSGTAKQGREIFAQKCQMCHGPEGAGIPAPPPGAGTPATGAAGGSMASLWEGKGRPLWSKNPDGVPAFVGGLGPPWFQPFFNMIWNAVINAMPGYKSGTLTPDEAYSLVAFIFAKAEIIPQDMVLNRETLPKVKMPQRDNYIPANVDDVLDIKKRGCYKTFSICEPIEVPDGAFQPPPYSEWR